MSKKKKSSEARFITPPNILKQKVGEGGIDQTKIQEAQTYIETVELDFAPYANTFLEDLRKQAKDAAKSGSDFEKQKEQIIGPIMQLKANGGMFKYQLVSDVADIALQFLEAIDEINEDTLEVLQAHETTIHTIMNNKLVGDGGGEGYALVKELDNACKRYFKKYKIKV